MSQLVRIQAHSSWGAIGCDLCCYTLSLLTACTMAQESGTGESGIRMEVDHAAARTISQWAFSHAKLVSAVRLESPNLEFAFRTNGKVVGEWRGDKSLSVGKTDKEFLDARYGFKVLVVFEQKTDKEKNTVIRARARIHINTRKGLGVYFRVPAAELAARKSGNEMLWPNSEEWRKKSQPWSEPLPRRDNNEVVVIWRATLERRVGRKIVETDDASTIELVARPVQ